MILCAASALAAGAELKPLDEVGYRKVVAERKGKVVLVNFWATYCVPCRAEMPKLVALDAKLRAKGFRLVTVSADEAEQAAQAKSFAEKAGMPAPAYVRRAKDDDAFVAAVDPNWNGALPASFLYDRQGRKVRAFFGEVDFKSLESAIAKLL